MSLTNPECIHESHRHKLASTRTRIASMSHAAELTGDTANYQACRASIDALDIELAHNLAAHLIECEGRDETQVLTDMSLEYDMGLEYNDTIALFRLMADITTPDSACSAADVETDCTCTDAYGDPCEHGAGYSVDSGFYDPDYCRYEIMQHAHDAGLITVTLGDVLDADGNTQAAIFDALENVLGSLDSYDGSSAYAADTETDYRTGQTVRVVAHLMTEEQIIERETVHATSAGTMHAESHGRRDNPLSGEWAEESVPELSARYGVDLSQDHTADAFESAFFSALDDDDNDADMCNECWGVPAEMTVDAGMFGDKDICETCYREYYSPRPIVERFNA